MSVYDEWLVGNRRYEKAIWLAEPSGMKAASLKYVVYVQGETPNLSVELFPLFHLSLFFFVFFFVMFALTMI